MKKQGFTLIELVMVIVIIGILAAVAIPRFANLRSNAQQAACDGNLGALRGALSAYYAKGAVSPTWDQANRHASGFPEALNGVGMVNCFLLGGTIPDCPLGSGNVATSVIYKNRYDSTDGTLDRHAHP